MRKATLFTLMVLMTATMAWAQTGKKCYDAIPIGKDNNFSDEIKSPTTKWYSAKTFDLPLTVYFVPKNGAADEPPIVSMDFTCTPGWYENDILCSLFCKTSASGGLDFKLPHSPTLETKTLDDGTFVYYMSMGKRYRDLLLQMGIQENLTVYVEVQFKSAGVLRLAPDDMFSNCMDGPKFMQFGDTIQVKAQDKDRHVIVPYVQWMEDSIRYSWQGEKKCVVTVAGSCDYDPTDQMDERILEFDEIAPNSSYKVTSEDITHYVKFADNQAGMFFAKVYSESDGILTVERIPMAPPAEGTILLHLDKPTYLNANDTNALYAIPKSWKTSVKFTTPTDHIFRMYVSQDPTFKPSNATQSYQFYPMQSGHWLGLYADDLASVWPEPRGNYLYVRFCCSEATSVTPTGWAVSDDDCAVSTILLDRSKTISVASQSPTIYRVYYPAIQGGSLSFKITDNKDQLDVLIADTCDANIIKPNYSGLIDSDKKKNKQVIIFDAARIATWADGVDEYGYIYIRIHPAKASTVDITYDAPEEKDPEYQHPTIAVVCEGSQVIVNVSENQHIVIEGTQEEWDAVVGTPHVLHLPTGTYTMKGEWEQIQIKL